MAGRAGSVHLAPQDGRIRPSPRPGASRTFGAVNENHARVCSSPEWAAWLHGEILPPLAAAVSLGEDMLEVGPGPGAATGWLRQRVRRLVALESDERAAAGLAAKYAGTNVEV